MPSRARGAPDPTPPSHLPPAGSRAAKPWHRIAEPCALALVYTTLCMLLPLLFPCTPTECVALEVSGEVAYCLALARSFTSPGLPTQCSALAPYPWCGGCCILLVQCGAVCARVAAGAALCCAACTPAQCLDRLCSASSTPGPAPHDQLPCRCHHLQGGELQCQTGLPSSPGGGAGLGALSSPSLPLYTCRVDDHGEGNDLCTPPVAEPRGCLFVVAWLKSLLQLAHGSRISLKLLGMDCVACSNACAASPTTDHVCLPSVIPSPSLAANSPSCFKFLLHPAPFSSCVHLTSPLAAR